MVSCYIQFSYNYVQTLCGSHAELLRYVGISESSLKAPCTVEDLSDIAGQISADSWMSLALKLGLSYHTLDDHCQEYQSPRDRRFQGLKKWKQEKAYRATYYAFVLACVKEKNNDLALNVCRIVKRHSIQ